LEKVRVVNLSYAPRAQIDISEIHDWLSKRSSVAASQVVAEIRSTAELIREYPGIGRSTTITGAKVLPVVHYPYLVYYTVEPEAVSIIHVRHAARDDPKPDEI
jgi:toxin ParE1/3/4